MLFFHETNAKKQGKSTERQKQGNIRKERERGGKKNKEQARDIERERETYIYICRDREREKKRKKKRKREREREWEGENKKTREKQRETLKHKQKYICHGGKQDFLLKRSKNTKKKKLNKTNPPKRETNQKKGGFRAKWGGPSGHLTWPLNPPPKKEQCNYQSNSSVSIFLSKQPFVDNLALKACTQRTLQ